MAVHDDGLERNVYAMKGETHMEDPMAIQYTKQAPQMEAEFEAEGPAPNHTTTDFADALAQLYRLLNEYAPCWYEKQHRQKAEDALRKIGRL